MWWKRVADVLLFLVCLALSAAAIGALLNLLAVITGFGLTIADTMT